MLDQNIHRFNPISVTLVKSMKLICKKRDKSHLTHTLVSIFNQILWLRCCLYKSILLWTPWCDDQIVWPQSLLKPVSFVDPQMGYGAVLFWRWLPAFFLCPMLVHKDTCADVFIYSRWHIFPPILQHYMDGWMDGWKVPGISMKSSRLGCSGVRPGWIISALLVYAEVERI